MYQRSRNKSFIKKNQSFTLNITSMTDMFTILLVFLLQTFNTSDVQLDMVQGIRLPTSNTEKNPVNGIKISLTQEMLKLDQVDLARVNNSEIENNSLDSHDSNFIKPLFTALQKINNESTSKEKIGRVLFQADQELPYSTLRKVMYTASMAGFPNIKLVTVAGN